MKRYFLVATAALALTACHKTADTTAAPSDTAASSAVTDASSAPASDTAPVAAATAPAAPEFVAMAAASDMYETQAAKIAESHAKTPAVKDFAMMMVTDHAKSTAMIKKAVADSGRTDIKPPTILPGDKKAMIDALNAAPAADFDKTYVDQQVMAHKDALALMTGYSTGGDVPQLKDAAGKIVPVVQMHLDKVTAMQASMK